MMDQKIIDFINEHEDLIDNNEWEAVYEKMDTELLIPEIGQFTKILLDANIHPENYLSELPKYFLYTTNITSFEIPDNIRSTGRDTFYHCTRLTSVIIPDSVKSIGYSVFAHCISLTSIVIPDGVTRICNYAFFNCTSLTSVTIGNGVETIGDSVFSNCTSLTNINYQGTREQWKNIKKSSNSFKSVPTSIVHCTDGASYLMAV